MANELLFPPEGVRNRASLTRFLSQAITTQYRVRTGEEDIRHITTYVKRYLLEAPSGVEHKNLLDFAANFGRIASTDEDELWRLDGTNDDSYFLDFQDPRFISVHSIAEARAADSMFDKLSSGGPLGTDRAWIPTEMMEGFYRGSRHLTGFKLSHSAVLPDVVAAPDQPQKARGGGRAQAQPRPGLRVEVSGTQNAMWELAHLQRSDVWFGRKALQQVEIRETAQRADVEIQPREPETMSTSIYANGKLIGHGNSIQLFMLTGNDVVSRYANAIRRIETSFTSGTRAGEPNRFRFGTPLVVIFTEGFAGENLQKLCETIFTIEKPFRIMKLFSRQAENRIDLEAIDLHTKHRFSVEVTSSWLRIYLPTGTCGNVVARLVCNLQHYLHSDLRVTTPDGEVVFSADE